MSKDEIKDIPLRELIRQQMTMTESLCIAVAKIETHNEYSQKAIADNEKDIDSLKDFRSQQKGAMAIIGAIGLTFIVDFFKRMTH